MIGRVILKRGQIMPDHFPLPRCLYSYSPLSSPAIKATSSINRDGGGLSVANVNSR